MNVVEMASKNQHRLGCQVGRVGVNMTEVNCDSQAHVALPYLGNCQSDQPMKWAKINANKFKGIVVVMRLWLLFNLRSTFLFTSVWIEKISRVSRND